MKKICLVIHSLGIGGMERVMSMLAEDFAKRPNVEIHLVLIGIKRQIDYSIPDSVIVHKPGFRFENKRRTIDTVRTILFIRQKINQISPDTLLSFGEMWNNLVLISTYGLNYPVFISDRSQPNKNLGKLHNLLRNLFYPSAAGYIAQTAYARNVCINKNWNNNTKVIGNPVNRIPEVKDVQKENIILFVGRLIKTKHVDQLIEIFNEINNRDWELCIVGGDAKRLSLSKELDAKVKELGIEDQVLLEGEQQNVSNYYNRSKIFAFTSSSEGFPNVIGEALSAGLPVVAYDCIAGPSDMINDGENGYLIELFNKDDFRKRLNMLIVDDELRKKMSKNARKSISKFDSNRIAEEFYNFITGSE